MVRDGITGYTFEAGNPDDLRKKINKLTKNSDDLLEFGANARKLVEEEFNSRKFYGLLLKIYRDALAAY